MNTLLEDLKRIKALVDTGLVYANSPYDEERYAELKEIYERMLSQVTQQPVEYVREFFNNQEDYPTPKVDVRAFIQNEQGEVLMAKEAVDGKWTIPGGWADVGYTASEVAVKEVKEETGLNVEVKRLLAVYDKKVHPHPPQPFYVYKIVFHCKVLDGEIAAAHDILDVNYFDLNQLPEISEDRILASQLHQLAKLVREDRMIWD